MVTISLIIPEVYRIVLTCDGVPPSCGKEAAQGITYMFADLGEQYMSAKCEWNGSELVLRAESEWDEDGGLTADFFFKSVLACARELAPEGGVSIESVEQISDNA
jgi:hypothetical protein